MITSTQNPKLKWVRALLGGTKARREAGAFVVEGVRLAEEALAAGWEAQLVLYTAEVSERGRDVANGFAAQGAAVEEAAPEALRAAADTQTPQGIVAVLSQRELPLPEKLDFAFLPDGVRDPGNLGTMLRTAAAAGVGVALIPPGAVDPFSPKVVRAAMGAHFRLPLRELSWDEIPAFLRRSGLSAYLADVGGGEVYTRVDLRGPLALIVGGEAEGAGQQAQALAQARLQIPMPGGSESLNAAVAAGILLFEVVRQRKKD